MSNTSQIVLSWNGATLQVEAANPSSGAREKVIGLSFRDLPIEMQMVLRENLSKIHAHKEMLAELNARNSTDARIARENEVNAANKRAAIEADLRWEKYIGGLAPHVAAYHQAKKAKRIAKSLATSREIYSTIASTNGQGIEFANKIIEPARRPKTIEVTKNGTVVTYWPRTDDNAATKKAKKKAGITGHIDTSDFTF